MTPCDGLPHHRGSLPKFIDESERTLALAGDLRTLAAGWIGSGPCSHSVAGGTVPIEEELMSGRPESTGDLRLRLRDTAFEVIYLATAVALEVVVMTLAGEFVPGGVTGNLDCMKPSVLDQRLDVPVDGGDADAGMVLERGLQGLLGR